MSNPGEGGSRRRRSAREAAKLLATTAVLAAVYFVAGRLGLLAPIAHDHVTLLWAPTGIALAAVILFGLRAVPGIALGAFLVNLLAGGPVAAAGIAVGNTLEAVAGALLLRRFGFSPSLDRVRDVLLLLGFGAIASPFISAGIGIASLAASGEIPAEGRALDLVSYWWIGDAMGALLVAPLLLTWAGLPRPWRFRRERLLEAAVLTAAFLVVSDLTLGIWLRNPILHPPLAFTLFPFLVWAAVRFGPRGAAAATLLAAAISVWETLEGRAPFAPGTLEERLMFHHTYMALAAVTAMLLAAVFSERRRAEADLLAGEERLREALTREQEARAQAESASEAKGRFLASLSHELRTPLTPVLAAVSALENDLRRRLDVVRRNVELEARLIDDLLDLTRVERGKLELHPEVTDARRVIENTIETCCEREVAAGSLRVLTDLAAGDHRIWADSSRLTQVLWNLLSNAVKFTPAGGTITVRSWHEGDLLVLQVSDTGVGVDPAALPRIFDAFEQGCSRGPRGNGGLGLGLAISKAIVELHGGQLTAASEGGGRGAAFTVSLPSALPRVDHDAGEISVAGEPVASVHEPKPRDGELRVLLVEDHADTAEAMAELLSMLGYQVTTAATVAEGLAAAHAEHFDLLLSDLGLPDGSGLDLMRELAAHNGLVGIALSGYGMEDDVRESLAAGFRKHLTKPVTLQQLESAIREVVG